MTFRSHFPCPFYQSCITDEGMRNSSTDLPN